jgi:hypothetical protein
VNAAVEAPRLKTIKIKQPFQLVNSKWGQMVFIKEGPADGKYWDSKRQKWILITIDPDSLVKTEFLGF